ncbi:hypothetical protein KR038_004979 [Drosophila bunnanda]|nr:hypothetical protein KR038_004979 [Drosophila bunnanda]
MAWLVILFLVCLRVTRADLPEISDQREPDLKEGLLHLLLRLRQEEVFDVLLIYGKDCIFHQLAHRLDLSTVLVSSGSTAFDWNFSSLTLIVSCGPEDDKEVTYRTLIKLQRNRRLIYIEKDIQPETVCEYFAKKEQYNIAMVRKDLNQSKSIYACRCFQDPNFQEVNLQESYPVYIENFHDMHGQPMRIMADLVAPRSMVYHNPKNGKTKMIGYVANLINYFALKVNATLEVRSQSVNVSFRGIIRRIKEDHIDIAMTMEASLHATNFDTTSYPYILTSYCLMLPVPDKLPFNLVYAVIVDHLVLGIIVMLFIILSILFIYSKKMSWQGLSLANVLLNDVSLRGLLGQSFPFPSNPSKQLRLIFIILCFASVMLTTMYESYLQSFFTHPPSEAYIRSFEDIGARHQTIAITTFKMDELKNNTHFQKISKDNLYIIESWKEYLHLRSAFNRSYGYLVTEDRWTSYAEQQKNFKQPLFYFARDLCFSRLLFLSIPMRRHLPYRHLFEEHMLRQHEVGLVRFWKSRSFFDMVRLDITPLEDLSHPKPYQPSLLLVDVSWIMKLYLAAMVISIVCFALEVLSESAGWRLGRYIKNVIGNS